MSWGNLVAIFTAGLSQQEQRAVLLGLIMGMFTLHTLWSCGLIPGFEGFATPTQVRTIAVEEIQVAEETIEQVVQKNRTQLTEEIRSLRVELIIERMEVLHTQICNSDSQELRRELAKRLQRNLAKYRGIQGYSYSLTPCEGI